MARGDSISTTILTASGGSTTTVRPANGVEWYIRFATASGSQLYWRSPTATNEIQTDHEGGNTGASQSAEVKAWSDKTHFMITYANYLRVYNESGGTRYWNYFGSQMK